MLTRYCPNCGTEVDETAIFCPTCGQPVDEAAETQMPPAPAWPDPAPPAPSAPEPAAPEPAAPDPAAPVWREPDAPAAEEPTRPVPPVPPAGPEPLRDDTAPSDDDPRYAVAAEEPAPAWRREPAPAGRDAEVQPPVAAPPPAPDAATGRRAPQRSTGPNVQVTAPVTLSGWLIGGGAVAGAIGALIALFRPPVNLIDLVLLLVLAAIAASVFAAASLPAFAHLRLATLGVAFVGFGMALERIASGSAGPGDLLLFLGTAAAAIGAILVELGQDQPLGGPRT